MEVFGGVSRSPSSAGGFSPIQVSWVPGLPGLLGSCSIELLPPSRSSCVQLPLPLLFIIPFAILVFLENFGFVGVDGVFDSGF